MNKEGLKMKMKEILMKKRRIKMKNVIKKKKTMKFRKEQIKMKNKNQNKKNVIPQVKFLLVLILLTNKTIQINYYDLKFNKII